MKRCPECRRDYYDDTLLYCLDDGNALLEGPASFGSDRAASAGGQFDEPQTAILPSFHPAGDPGTRKFPVFEHDSLPPNNSIAVLPFLNLNPDMESDYFSDGLSEELINVLSKIQRLRVAARTSAFSFKQKHATVAEIGRILNVASVLEGSVRKVGDRVRIAVQLITVKDGYHLWSETYDRTMNDIFAVQDDIARCVVGELQGLLLGREPEGKSSVTVMAEVAAAIKGRSSDPEAQRLMLLGRYFLDRTTQPDSEKAVRYFREAVEIDPGFALGWTELGMAYSVQAGRSWRPATEGFELARQAANRAMELEPELAEAHALLGRIKAAYDRNIPEAEQCYRRAMELAPGSASVMDGVCILTYKMGRFNDAIELAQKVLEKDPLASAFWHNLGLVCHSCGRLDDAEAAYRRAIDLAPHRSGSPSMLALVLLDGGKSMDAIKQLDSEPDEFWRLWGRAILNSKLGNADEAQTIAAKLEAEYSAGNEFQIAEVYAEIGETDKAFEWLDKAVNGNDPGVTHAKASLWLRKLHNDERWPILMSKIGF